MWIFRFTRLVAPLIYLKPNDNLNANPNPNPNPNENDNPNLNPNPNETLRYENEGKKAARVGGAIHCAWLNPNRNLL